MLYVLGSKYKKVCVLHSCCSDFSNIKILFIFMSKVKKMVNCQKTFKKKNPKTTTTMENPLSSVGELSCSRIDTTLSIDEHAQSSCSKVHVI